MACRLKKTKELHPVWLEYDQMPQEIKNRTRFLRKRSIIGKWHYHYENKNGRIGLVRLNHSMSLSRDGHCWEACGVLDFQRFYTKKEAEIEIYKALKEKQRSENQEKSTKKRKERKIDRSSK